MRTTILNPTVWLLLAVALSAAAGVWRRETARQSLARVIRGATGTAALAALALAACGGFAARAVVGYLSPGAYAEEVVSARAFLEDRTLYGGDRRAELAAWMAEAPADPFSLPGITPCQANAMANRPRFFTSQGHPPTLLLASVPVVGVAGGRGLFVLLTLASSIAVALAGGVLAREAGVPLRSRTALGLVLAVAGWQPVLAGVRQGDAVIPAAALVVLAWHLAGRGDGRSAVAGAIAPCLALPAIGVWPALLRCRPRAGALALLIASACVGLALAAGGVLVLADFASALLFSAHTYADALPNYAVVGRLLLAGVPPSVLIGLFVAAAIAGLARGRSVDGAFGTALMLGLLAMPIVWSQHLALALVPLAVLLRRIEAGGASIALVCWALLGLLVSLPDPAVTLLSERLPIPSPVVIPFVPGVMAVLWGWLLLGGDGHLRRNGIAKYRPAPVAP